jgi:hypothetical protein
MENQFLNRFLRDNWHRTKDRDPVPKAMLFNIRLRGSLDTPISDSERRKLHWEARRRRSCQS